MQSLFLVFNQVETLYAKQLLDDVLVHQGVVTIMFNQRFREYNQAKL